LLIGVTSFFRDPTAWNALRDQVLPALVKARRDETIRAWVVGCSTGEEAYSLAIVIKEALDALRGSNVRVQVFATDLDRDAVARARLGLYPTNIMSDVSPERLRRFFTKDERGYRVSKEIREVVMFAPQNVLTDPPFTKLDIIVCRNLLIYFTQELQKKLIPLFHYALNPGGALFLGTAEAIGNYAQLFKSETAKARIYRRLKPARPPAIDFPTSFMMRPPKADGARNDAAPAASNVQALVERILAEDRYASAGVLTSDKGDIVFVSGRTGKYLEAPSGRANWNVLAMAREDIKHAVALVLSSATRNEGPALIRDVELRSGGTSTYVDISAEKLRNPEPIRGKILVVFRPAARDRPSAKRSKKKRSSGLEDELRRTRLETTSLRERMQSSEEDLTTANEELQTTNEELQSTNEELQSTNEELTTSKEELQSLNEELQTVNHELQSKVDELSRSNNDMNNLLNSTDVATLFLDNQLRVRRFTTQTSKLIKLIPGDTGRPITDIAMNIEYPTLADDAREVLRTLVSHETLVRARDGRWFSVRMLPYRTLDDVIDGVVITFTDATTTKQLEANLREQTDQLRQLAESLPNLVFGCLPSGECDFLSTQWVGYTGVAAANQLGRRWLEQVHEEDREALGREWTGALKRGTMLNAAARIRKADGTFRWFKIRAAPIQDDQGRLIRWYGSCTDVDDLKRT
jgi:two-component system, chemotaxis family, CheB/CheR fusion protein